MTLNSLVYSLVDEKDDTSLIEMFLDKSVVS